MSAGINAAVLHLADRGRISATGCMVGRSAWAAGAQRLQAVSPLLLDVGLRLDLSALPGRDGADCSLGRLIAGCYLRLARHPSLGRLADDPIAEARRIEFHVLNAFDIGRHTEGDRPVAVMPLSQSRLRDAG